MYMGIVIFTIEAARPVRKEEPLSFYTVLFYLDLSVRSIEILEFCKNNFKTCTDQLSKRTCA